MPMHPTDTMQANCTGAHRLNNEIKEKEEEEEEEEKAS